MGNVLIQASRQTKRVVHRFNVFNRAQRAIEKDSKKPRKAPDFPATVLHINRMNREMPEVKDELLHRNEQLYKNLQNVYVRSTGNNLDINAARQAKCASNSKLPQVRTEPETKELVVPPGKFSVEQASQFLVEHSKNDEQFTAEVLAKKYNIDNKIMENILTHVKVFNYYAPPVKVKSHMQKLKDEMMPTFAKDPYGITDRGNRRY